MQLSKKWSDKLMTLPEQGMGYQIVDVYLKNGFIVRSITILNCQTILNQNLHFSEKDIQDIKLKN